MIFEENLPIGVSIRSGMFVVMTAEDKILFKILEYLNTDPESLTENFLLQHKFPEYKSSQTFLNILRKSYDDYLKKDNEEIKITPLGRERLNWLKEALDNERLRTEIEKKNVELLDLTTTNLKIQNNELPSLNTSIKDTNTSVRKTNDNMVLLTIVIVFLTASSVFVAVLDYNKTGVKLDAEGLFQGISKIRGYQDSIGRLLKHEEAQSDSLGRQILLLKEEVKKLRKDTAE